MTKRKRSIDTTCSESSFHQQQPFPSDIGSTPPPKAGLNVTVQPVRKPPPSEHSTDMAAEDSSEDSSQDAARRKKKARTTFTGRQIFELEKQFEVKKYLSSSERADMAKLLTVTETQVNLNIAIA